MTTEMKRKRETAVALLGSPSPGSSSGRIADLILGGLGDLGWETTLIDLSALPSEALLGREKNELVASAVTMVAEASIVIPATPTYRATYTGLLKVFFDLLPPESLRSCFGIPVQTGGSPDHALSVAYGLEPLLRSLGALVSSKGIYAWGEHWSDGKPGPQLQEWIDDAVQEADSAARLGGAGQT